MEPRKKQGRFIQKIRKQEIQAESQGEKKNSLARVALLEMKQYQIFVTVLKIQIQEGK